MELELKEDKPKPSKEEQLRETVDKNLKNILKILRKKGYDIIEPTETPKAKPEEEPEREKREKTRVIGFAGKGGVGKTTLAALFLRAILEKNSSTILAVDSDPNLCLPDLLGVKNYETLSSLIEKRKGKRLRPRRFKQEFNSLLLKNEQEGYDLLPMGRSEGQGCYCAVNNLLRSAFNSAVLGGNYAYDFVIVDCEAGLEHFSRKTSAIIEDLVVVTDGSKMGSNTIKNIRTISDEIKIDIENFYIIANRVGNEKISREIRKLSREVGMDYLGNLPEDPEIRKLNQKGKSLFKSSNNSTAYSIVKDMVDQILSKAD